MMKYSELSEKEDKTSDNRNILNKILFIIIGILLFTITAGTVFALLTKKNQTPELLLARGRAESLMAPSDNEETAYFELGTIRISTAGDEDSPPTLLIVSPWLAYPAGDTVFYEELSRKSGALKGIFSAYFSAYTKNQLLSETEEKIEIHLRQEINASLSLGIISSIYFTDYLFLE